MRETILAHVRRTMIDAQLVRPGERVLLGVSGGPDSVALFHLFVQLKASLKIQVAVVHVDHQLRSDSATDAAFVEDLARRFEVPVTVVRRDVLREVKHHGWSLEDGARRIRYDIFCEAAKHQRADRLALAHTADDQAETVLMRLIRGAGVSGLSAIPLTRRLGELHVIRPLLGIWRTDVMAYLNAHRVRFREDATNHDPRFLRNRIRLHLLPLLEREYNPKIKTLLVQLAEQCRTDTTYLLQAAQRYWKRLVKTEQEGVAIRVDPFVKQPKALQRQLIRLAIQYLQGDLARFEFRHWGEIERLFLERPVGTILDLPNRLSLERGQDRVRVRVNSHPPTAAPLDPSTRATASGRGPCLGSS